MSRVVEGFTAVLGALLIAAAAASVVPLTMLIHSGLNKGGDFGALGVIAAGALALIGIPLVLFAGFVGYRFVGWRRDRLDRAAALSALIAAACAVLTFNKVGPPAVQLATSSAVALFSIHAVAAFVTHARRPSRL